MKKRENQLSKISFSSFAKNIKNTRPTAGRVKKALFDILFSQFGSLENKSFLDLFSGTGSVGILAHEKKASPVYLIESSSQNYNNIQKYINNYYINNNSIKAICGDCLKLKASNKLNNIKFDIIFADPPYDIEEEKLKILNGEICEYLKPEGLFIFETRAKKNNLESIFIFFSQLSEYKYGDSKLVFFEFNNINNNINNS